MYMVPQSDIKPGGSSVNLESPNLRLNGHDHAFYSRAYWGSLAGFAGTM